MQDDWTKSLFVVSNVYGARMRSNDEVVQLAILVRGLRRVL